MQGSTGDPWQEWLAANAPKLLLFARQQARNPGDAEDLLQESVVESSRRQGDGSPPPLPLVYATIRRRAIDRARAEDRRRAREAGALESGEPWFLPSPGAKSDARAIQDSLLCLPVEQREVLTMKIWGDMTFQEIAEALGISINTAASRYRYALEAMRKELRERT